MFATQKHEAQVANQMYFLIGHPIFAPRICISSANGKDLTLNAISSGVIWCDGRHLIRSAWNEWWLWRYYIYLGGLLLTCSCWSRWVSIKITAARSVIRTMDDIVLQEILHPNIGVWLPDSLNDQMCSARSQPGHWRQWIGPSLLGTAAM